MDSIAIVGLGAIGCHSAQLIARARVKKLVLIDRDIVESSNLERQPLYSAKDIGRPKAEAASAKLKEQFPETEIIFHVADLDSSNPHLLDSEMVLDCTDNLETRFLINEICLKEGIPWIHSAAISDVCTVMPFPKGAACFRCIFQGIGSNETCDTAGVNPLAPVAAAALQVSEAMQFGSQLMHRLDFAKGTSESFSLKKNPACPACNGNYEYLSGKFSTRSIRLCGTGSFQIRGRQLDLAEVRERLARISEVRDFGSCISMEGLTLFSDGRALIKADSEAQARSKYARMIGS